MNKLDLVEHFGSSKALAKVAKVSEHYMSLKIGYRLPEAYAKVIAANSDVEYKKEDYRPRKTIYKGESYWSQYDVCTVDAFKVAVKTKDDLFFNVNGEMKPIESFMALGELELIRAFRAFELFQKGV